jgi:transcription-repair coupling factor (superfamily II helicase)
MPEHHLADVMHQFTAGEVDILLSTSIIESGLDIPNANTLIVDRGDTFGLAQLYQLRGRVGRGAARAYAYFFRHRRKAPTLDGQERLEVIAENTQLGAGYSIAMRDLEIRGAGDLLGARQSGHIAAVGFDTYARILEEAVAELKGQPITRETDPELNTCVAAFIPDDFVDDTGQRLELYKRLSEAARDEDAVAQILAEIRDRYGPIPAEVEALGELMILKGLAAALGATVIDLSESRLALTLSEATPLQPAEVVKLVSDRRSGFKLTPEMRLIHTLGAEERQHPLRAAKRVLHALLARANA